MIVDKTGVDDKTGVVELGRYLCIYFLIPHQVCSEVVISNLDLDNCCSLYRMSQQLSQSNLWWHCTRFIVDHYNTVVSLPDYAKVEESSRRELKLMYETLLLNPMGKGKGFGCIRELIGTLSEVSKP